MDMMGLVSDQIYQAYLDKMSQKFWGDRLDTIRFTLNMRSMMLWSILGSARLTEGISAKELIKRPELTYEK